MKSFIVLYTPESGHLESFGPFETYASAKEWMAQDFNDNMKVAKKFDVDPQWTWNERSYGNLGSCTIEGVGSWQIVELTK